MRASSVSCVQSLIYVSRTDAYPIAESLSLSNHSKLEYLRIWITTSPFSDHISLFASWVSQLLSPSLVCLNICFFKNLDSEVLSASKSSWKAVDDALSDPKVTRLTYFVMTLHHEYEGILDRQVLRTTFKNLFPKSYLRGILWVAKMNRGYGWRGEHFP